MSVHNPLVLTRWRAIFAAHRRSGLSIAALCRSRAINKSGFHRWRNTLEQLEHARAEPKPSPAFVPVRVVPEAASVPLIEVVLPSGIQLRVPPGADASQVARLAQALVGAKPC